MPEPPADLAYVCTGQVEQSKEHGRRRRGKRGGREAGGEGTGLGIEAAGQSDDSRKLLDSQSAEEDHGEEHAGCQPPDAKEPGCQPQNGRTGLSATTTGGEGLRRPELKTQRLESLKA